MKIYIDNHSRLDIADAAQIVTDAAIHDVDYHFAPVSRQKADRRFLDNMVRHWHTAYGNRSTSRIIAHA